MSWRIVCDNNDEMSELLNPTSLEGYPSRTRAIREKESSPWFRRPWFYAVVVLAVFVALNIKFF